MIKVNLLLNKGMAANEVADFDVSNDITGSSNEQKEVIIKVLIMALFVSLLFLFESYNLGLLQDHESRLYKEIQDKEQEINKFGNISGEAAKQKKMKEELEFKKKIIRELAKSRITALKALDFLQNIIPTKVWLNDLKLKDESLIFEGQAITEEELNEFLSQLERRKNYFKDVIIEKSEDKQTKQGLVKNFIISAKLVVEKS